MANFTPVLAPVLLLLASVSIANAEPPAPGPSSSPSRFAVEGTVGINSPLGVGVEINATVTPWLTVGAGVGKRFVLTGGPYVIGADADTQVGAMVRARRPISSKVELGAGLGVSMGRHVNDDVPFEVDNHDDSQEWASAKWANAEIYAKAGGKLYVRGFVGASALLNPRDCMNYYDTACKQDTPLGKIYGGASVGYDF